MAARIGPNRFGLDSVGGFGSHALRKHGAYSTEARELLTLAPRNRERFRALEAEGKKLGLW